MMEEEEDTLFDQEVLLGHKEEVAYERSQRRQKILKTAALSMSFFCLGLCVAIPGPTLLELGMRVNKDLHHMTFIFTARSVGYLVGSLVGGILSDFCDQQILLLYTMAATAVATASIPWCRALSAMSAFISVQGVALGVLGTGGNVFCIKIWGKKSEPFMQVLHFAFGIGAFLAPLMSQPFLVDSMMTSGNLSQVDFYPVNFKIPALDSMPSHDHLTSEAVSSGSLFMNGDDGLPDPGLITNHKRDWLAQLAASGVKDFDGSELISPGRVKRQTGNGTYSSASAFNETVFVTNWVQQNITVALLPPTTAGPFKPNVLEGSLLDKNFADAAQADRQIRNIKQTLGVAQTGQETKTEFVNYLNSTSILPSTKNDNLTVANKNSTDGNLTVYSEVSTSMSNPLSTSTTTPTTIILTSESSSSSSLAMPTSTDQPSTVINAVTTSQVNIFSTLTAERSEPTESPLISPTFQAGPFTFTDNTSASNLSVTSTDFPPQLGEEIFDNIVSAIVGMSRIQIAYSLIGVMLVFNSGFYFYLYCRDRKLPPCPSLQPHADPTRHPDTKCFISSLMVLLFSFFLVYVGMEVTYGGLLATFAVHYPMEYWTPAKAAILTAAFWGCLALGRFLAIIVARFFKPPCMMVTNLGLTIVGALILGTTVQLSSVMLWVGTVTLGLGMSSLFPTAISWANVYYPLTGRATAIFVTGSGVGEMVIPVLTGFLFERTNPMALMYTTLALSVLLAVVYLTLQLLVYRRGKSSPVRSHSGFMRLNNLEDVAETDVTELTDSICTNNRGKNLDAGKQNGASYNMTEFAVLVDLSD